MIDFHAHVLPGVDHGSDCVETSLAQLARAAKVGIQTIVATPHFYYQERSLDEFLSLREQAYDVLVQQDLPSGLTVLKGAEVTLALELVEMPGLEKLCIADTDYILLELPDGCAPSWIYDTLYKIEANRGLKPIIAHIDRYVEYVQEALFDTGFLIQVNASAFLSFLSGRRYRKLFRDGHAHLLGSDVHGAAAVEYTQFQRACKVLGKDVTPIMQRAQQILSTPRSARTKQGNGGA